MPLAWNAPSRAFTATGHFRNETPEYLANRWFARQGDQFKIDSSIRDMVTFGLLNLVSDDYPAAMPETQHMDLIMFRNVSIYFDQPTTLAIIKRLQSALTADGWLVVGHAEPLASIYQGFATQNFPNAVFTRTPLGSQRSSVYFHCPFPPRRHSSYRLLQSHLPRHGILPTAKPARIFRQSRCRPFRQKLPTRPQHPCPPRFWHRPNLPLTRKIGTRPIDCWPSPSARTNSNQRCITCGR